MVGVVTVVERGRGVALKDNRAGRTSQGEITRLLHPLRGRKRKKKKHISRLGAIVDSDQTWQAISAEI